MVWWEEQKTRCPGCGTYDWEWDPAQGGDEHAWWADKWVCPGCRQRDETQRGFQQEAQYLHPSLMDGAQIRLFRTPREEKPDGQ